MGAPIGLPAFRGPSANGGTVSPQRSIHTSKDAAVGRAGRPASRLLVGVNAQSLAPEMPPEGRAAPAETGHPEELTPTCRCGRTRGGTLPLAFPAGPAGGAEDGRAPPGRGERKRVPGGVGSGGPAPVATAARCRRGRGRAGKGNVC